MANRNPKGFIDEILGDVSKSSATKQLLLGASSGWLTGFVAMQFGKVLGTALGGGIILLELANEKGYIKINWDKVNRKLDKVSDKVEENITGQGPSWSDKVERYVDRKVNKAEDALKSGQKRAKSWYSTFTGEPGNRLTEAQIFLFAFVGGVAIGICTSK